MVLDSGQHVKINPKTRQVTETENPLVPKPLLDVVLSGSDEVLSLGAEGTVLTAGEPCSTQDTYRLDLKAKTGLSVSKYGSKVWQVGVWGQNTLLLIGDTLLCCKHTSNSIFPLHKGMSAEAIVLPAGPTLGFVNREQVSVLTDINGNWVDYPYKIVHGLAAITPDGKYLVCVDASNVVRLVRVEDQAELASFTFLVGVTSLGVSGDSAFVVIGGNDGRLYPYIIADPQDSSHDERIKGLASRQQPFILHIERPHDPRYKVLRYMTSRLETESFAGSEKNSDADDDDDDDDDDSDSDSDSEDDADSEDMLGESDSEESDEEQEQDTSPDRAAEANNNGGGNGEEEAATNGHGRRSGSGREKQRKKSAKKKSVFMPLPNGSVCLAPVTYRQPELQAGHKNRIQKISNRFTEVAITEEPAAEAAAKNTSEMRKAWTAPPVRDPRKASSRLTNINKRKGTSMSSPRPSSRGDAASRACVIS